MITEADCTGYYSKLTPFMGIKHWSGCSAGIDTIGIESDGSIKGCLSMQEASYIEGNIREKSLKTEIDYIVAAAYCLVHYENVLRFTEEQIKAKIAPFFEEELDHNFVLDAVAKNLIKVLPDFTGFSDTIEFELTEQGEEYFLNEL